MTDEMMPVPAGTIVAFTDGAYSDYSVRALGRAVRDLDPCVLRDEWIALHPEQKHDRWYRINTHQFLAWLVSRGDVEELAYTEWHVDDYHDGGFLIETAADRLAGEQA